MYAANTFSILQQVVRVSTDFKADPQLFEARLPNGLVRGHAYSITGMKMVMNNFEYGLVFDNDLKDFRLILPLVKSHCSAFEILGAINKNGTDHGATVLQNGTQLVKMTGKKLVWFLLMMENFGNHKVVKHKKY